MNCGYSYIRIMIKENCPKFNEVEKQSFYKKLKITMKIFNERFKKVLFTDINFNKVG